MSRFQSRLSRIARQLSHTTLTVITSRYSRKLAITGWPRDRMIRLIGNASASSAAIDSRYSLPARRCSGLPLRASPAVQNVASARVPKPAWAMASSE